MRSGKSTQVRIKPSTFGYFGYVWNSTIILKTAMQDRQTVTANNSKCQITGDLLGNCGWHLQNTEPTSKGGATLPICKYQNS